ncbi:hypothetical protein HAX54_052945, partial [Datura stramonium]|nr:hypothetical protein [Datura stramonium]
GKLLMQDFFRNYKVAPTKGISTYEPATAKELSLRPSQAQDELSLLRSFFYRSNVTGARYCLLL